MLSFCFFNFSAISFFSCSDIVFFLMTQSEEATFFPTLINALYFFRRCLVADSFPMCFVAVGFSLPMVEEATLFCLAGVVKPPAGGEGKTSSGEVDSVVVGILVK